MPWTVWTAFTTDPPAALLQRAFRHRQVPGGSDVRTHHRRDLLHLLVVLLAARVVLDRGVDLVGHGSDIDGAARHQLGRAGARSADRDLCADQVQAMPLYTSP
jgi:hypothetical protein